MAKSKDKSGSKDKLLRTSPKGAVRLSEAQLDKVAGGVHKDKMQSANKNAEAVRKLL